TCRDRISTEPLQLDGSGQPPRYRCLHAKWSCVLAVAPACRRKHYRGRGVDQGNCRSSRRNTCSDSACLAVASIPHGATHSGHFVDRTFRGEPCSCKNPPNRRGICGSRELTKSGLSTTVPGGWWSPDVVATIHSLRGGKARYVARDANRQRSGNGLGGRDV